MTTTTTTNPYTNVCQALGTNARITPCTTCSDAMLLVTGHPTPPWALPVRALRVSSHATRDTVWTPDSRTELTHVISSFSLERRLPIRKTGSNKTPSGMGGRFEQRDRFRRYSLQCAGINPEQRHANVRRTRSQRCPGLFHYLPVQQESERALGRA